ncbi:hypothetical protein SKAU_G00216160 [Synaphobranchus kaupii]|uniref:Uncharacterized protein n=1 Tax=Synaphobranchus kaupii TaxID=118154 RepID=A0A9Q1IV22_SYNKA|nr:hypothetical protein SKAU_G00216160 [Synaphobranchus kaupii]
MWFEVCPFEDESQLLTDRYYLVTDNKDTVIQCGRGESEEAAGSVHSVILTLYGISDPQRPPNDSSGPSQMFVSMGERHHTRPPLSLSKWRSAVSGV